MADNNETIQLIIDAKNLSTDKLDKAANDLDGLGKAANKADKELEGLKIEQDTIKTYQEMAVVTRNMKRELAESEVKYENLTAAIKKSKTVTDEQRASSNLAKQSLIEQRKAVASQVKEYDRLRVTVKEYGVHSRNAVQHQVELSQSILKGEINLRKKTKALDKNTAALKKNYVAEKKVSDSIDKKVALDKKAAAALEKLAIETKKVAQVEVKAAKEQVRVTQQLIKYEKALDKLNKEKKEGTITTGDYIRKEEKLRKQLKLNESQAKATRKAIEADNATTAKKSKSTDLLTTATRRLAQAYTVLIAAQKAAEAVTTSVKGYGELEAAITRVEKTTGLAREEVVAMGDELRVMAEDITPTATNELLRYGEVAGQMGVNSTEAILSIAAAADALAVSTDLAGDEAATLSARILGMTGEGVEEIHNFASALVELGNNTKTTESEIAHMTKEIVTGTTAIGFGSAAAAGFGATLKELGQPAERSRSAMMDLTNVILDLANEGGEGLEQLIKTTGLTGEAIEEGLGKEPEQVVIRFVEGLKRAATGSTTLKTVLAGFGVTSKETNAVVGALVKNTDRLTHVVNLSTKAYVEGNKHFEEASKAYSDQDAVLLRLANKFTTLKTKIGEAYSPTVIEYAQDFGDAIKENENAVIDIMQYIPELVEGVAELGEAFNDVVGSFGDSTGVFERVYLGWKNIFNGITILLKTTAQGVISVKAHMMSFFGATDKEILKLNMQFHELSVSIAKDQEDIAKSSERLAGTSSLAFENLTKTLYANRDAFNKLTQEQQDTITALIENTDVTSNLNSEYYKYATILARTGVELKVVEAQEKLANKAKEKSARTLKTIVDVSNEVVVATDSVSDSSDKATQALDEYTKSTNKLDLSLRKIKLKITELETAQSNLTEADGKQVEISQKLASLYEQRADTSKKLAIQKDLETKTSTELLIVQQQHVQMLELLELRWKSGALTAAEYTKAKEDAAFKTAALTALLGDESDRVVKLTNDIIKLQQVQQNGGKVSKKNTEILQQQNQELQKNAGHAGVSNALANRWLILNKQLHKELDYTALSYGDLGAELKKVKIDLHEFNIATAKATHDTLGIMKPIDDMTRKIAHRKVAIIEETQALNSWISRVESGTMSLEALAGMAGNADRHFTRLGENQLDPLLAAIEKAKAEIRALSAEINDTFEDVQDRLDEILGNESDILKRKFAREMEEMEELLRRATESGNRALIDQINAAIRKLRQVQKLEYKEEHDENYNPRRSTKSSDNDNGFGSKYRNKKSSEVTVNIKLPDGKTTPVDVVSGGDADALVSALTSIGEININGVQ